MNSLEMDADTNQYSPSADTSPPELHGREEILESAAIALDRVRSGLSAQSLLLVGLRGVGKTVLLNRIAWEAEARGFITVSVETSKDKSLPATLVSPLHAALHRLDKVVATGGLAKHALRVLGGFVCATKVKYHDIEFDIALEEEPATADSGNLEHDLIDLFLEVGRASREIGTAIVFCIDNLQHLEAEQFAALIAALHKCAQLQLPVALIGAGPRELVGNAGRAKSYAERLFKYPEIEPWISLNISPIIRN